MQKLNTFVFISLLLVGSITNAENLATTDDGKRVSLKNDGTWEYIAIQKKIISHKTYSDDLVEVTLRKACLVNDVDSKSYVLELLIKVTVKTKTKIVGLKTYAKINYFISIVDNFGNNFWITSLSQTNSKYSLRPNEEETFTIRTKDYPLETSSFIEISINKELFGNQKAFTFKIPTSDIEKT